MYSEITEEFYNVNLDPGAGVIESNTVIANLPQIDGLIKQGVVEISPRLTVGDAEEGEWVFGIKGKVSLYSELSDPATEPEFVIYIVTTDEPPNDAGWYQVRDVGGVKEWQYFHNPGAASVTVDDITIKIHPTFGYLYVASGIDDIDGGFF